MSWTKQLRFKHLDLLIELAESGSLSDAARATHSTQPSLSKWLRDLEDDIGSPLFERHARGLKPTALGSMMIAHARRMKSEIDRTQQDLNSLIQGGSRILSVGTSPAAAPNYVPGTIMRFLREHPNARIHVEEGTMNAMLEKLALGKLDLVVGRMDNYRPSERLRSTILYDERLTVVARPNHPLTQKIALQWRDLYEYDWIVWPDGTPIRAKLDHALTAAGMKPAPMRVESSSQVANLWMITYSNMLSISSERVARHFSERGLVVQLPMEIAHAEGSVGMCWRDNQEDDALLQSLLECFKLEAEKVTYLD
ncbi:LysR substrate-binding domain-containing protein [Oceanobacter kriegii]|uniref:LysR substrate-binding domain-containing protein n=1 Tax=Oceanobacter kriegii TaxID=64972 RepID=UPI0004295388|nr:LysR substrate-binding domain-containing protein [Oceanobacter kriegii]